MVARGATGRAATAERGKRLNIPSPTDEAQRRESEGGGVIWSDEAASDCKLFVTNFFSGANVG